MKKPGKVITIFVVLIILVIAAVLVAVYATKSNEENGEKTTTSSSQTEEKKEEGKTIEYSTDIEVVPTLLDEISTNSAWCATFQLIWNDMQDEVVKQDIVFNPQISIVENLNQQSFTEDNISEEYYYKTYGLFTQELKEEIEEGIAEKFDEPSDILDDFDWDSAPEDESGYEGEDYKIYFFYTMLYREFNFAKAFDVLDEDEFEGTQETYEDIEYFGIDSSSSEQLYSQVDVLYYNSDEDFAVILNTEEGDQVVLCKGENGNTFEEIWDSMNEKAEEYDGDSDFTENDTLKVPKIKMDVLREYEELETDGTDESKIFYDADGNECYIMKAIQTIQFELDETGGKIKSEAGIEAATFEAVIIEEESDPRYFEFDSTFTMFLLEDGQELPYFAANIDDITLYQ